MANKGILITGGSGLVGAYAVQMLLERGERPVIFDVAVNERLLGAVGVDTSKVTMIRGDMADMPALISALRDNDCDQIIHLAAFLGEEVQRRPYSGVRLNFMGTINVFEAARLENVKRVVFPSSGTVYLGSLGEGVKQIDENIPMNPPSVYAATKASCEFMGRAYAKRYGFEFICLRYTGGLYGPSPAALKATREIAIQQMIRAAVKGEAAKINWPYGPAEILYGKDAAKGTVLGGHEGQVQRYALSHRQCRYGQRRGYRSRRSARNSPAPISRSSKLPIRCPIPTRACRATSPGPRSSWAMSRTIPSTRRWRITARL